MNETESYIADQIRLRVWSGLCEHDEVQEMISDILEEDADEQMLRELVAVEFDRKSESEKSWPDRTDFDRLDAAFSSLRQRGIIAIHNAGWDKSEAFHNCLEEFRAQGKPEHLFGICYYTSQDIDGAINGRGIYLGYSSTRPEMEESDAVRAGTLICSELEKVRLQTEWGGNAQSRIKVDLVWQKRG
ncbi:MAG: hypothetical protein AAGI68_05285 [Planctomycetota bacterium]